MNTPNPYPRNPAQARALQGLPEHMRSGARAYVAEGLTPGGFLGNLLAGGNLLSVAQRADAANLRALDRWAAWLETLPMVAWGTPERVDAWVARGGIVGNCRPVCAECTGPVPPGPTDPGCDVCTPEAQA